VQQLDAFSTVRAGSAIIRTHLSYDTGYSVVITLNQKHDNRETQITLETPAIVQFYSLRSMCCAFLDVTRVLIYYITRNGQRECDGSTELKS
jgi:hypothetical protein